MVFIVNQNISNLANLYKEGYDGNIISNLTFNRLFYNSLTRSSNISVFEEINLYRRIVKELEKESSNEKYITSIEDKIKQRKINYCPGMG